MSLRRRSHPIVRPLFAGHIAHLACGLLSSCTRPVVGGAFANGQKFRNHCARRSAKPATPLARRPVRQRSAATDQARGRQSPFSKRSSLEEEFDQDGQNDRLLPSWQADSRPGDERSDRLRDGAGASAARGLGHVRRGALNARNSRSRELRISVTQAVLDSDEPHELARARNCMSTPRSTRPRRMPRTSTRGRNRRRMIVV